MATVLKNKFIITIDQPVKTYMAKNPPEKIPIVLFCFDFWKQTCVILLPVRCGHDLTNLQHNRAHQRTSALFCVGDQSSHDHTYGTLLFVSHWSTITDVIASITMIIWRYREKKIVNEYSPNYNPVKNLLIHLCTALSSSNESRFTKWPMLWRRKWTVRLRFSWFNQHLGGFVNGNDFKWLDFICPFIGACTFNRTLRALQLQVHATICAHIWYYYAMNMHELYLT